MKVELELITEFDILLVVEIDIRSGMYYTFDQYEKVNNKYMNDYYKKKQPSYHKYWDSNNLYGWAMSQKLVAY